MADKHYVIATQTGYLVDSVTGYPHEFATRGAAVKVLSQEVKEAAAECRRSYGSCSVVGSAKSGSVQIRVGGRQGYNLWQRYVINERPGSRKPRKESSLLRELRAASRPVETSHATKRGSTDLRRRAFGPHPTAEDWRSASKSDIEQALAAEVIRRNPKLYAGYDEDAVKFVRNTMGSTKWDLLLAAESFGLAPQGTYLYPDERKQKHHHATVGPAGAREPVVGQWYRIEWNPAGKQVQIRFDDRLNEETRALLKSRGFRKAPGGLWRAPASEGSWWSAIEIARRAS